MKESFTTLLLLFVMNTAISAGTPFDINYDGIINMKDFAAMANDWMEILPEQRATANRDYIYIEQNNLYQADPDRRLGRGANIWLPLGNTKGSWQFWRMQVHSGTLDKVDCWELYGHYACEVVKGEQTSMQRLNETTAFNRRITLPNNGFDFRRLNHIWSSAYGKMSGGILRYQVPDNTTRLYMIGYPRIDGGAARISFSQGNGAIIKDILSWSSVEGDFGSEFDEFFDSCILVATDIENNSYIDITAIDPFIRICGFIAINDDEWAEPDEGVFDPETIKSLLPSGQVSEGPIRLNFGNDSASRFWWGLGHWTDKTGKNTLINETQKLYYGHNGHEWNPIERERICLRTNILHKILKGDIQVYNPLTDEYFVIGDFDMAHSFSCSGLSITQKWNFNSDAELANIYLQGSFAGYAGQWALNSDHFNRAISFPYTSEPVEIGPPWDDSSLCTQNSSSLAMYGTESTLIALFNVHSRFYGENGLIPFGRPRGFINKRGEGFPKFYCPAVYWFDEKKIKEGDYMESTQYRVLTDMDSYKI